jgi:hypothetical protein
MEIKKEKIYHQHLSDQERILRNRERGRNNPNHKQKISNIINIVKDIEKNYVEADDSIEADQKKE